MIDRKNLILATAVAVFLGIASTAAYALPSKSARLAATTAAPASANASATVALEWNANAVAAVRAAKVIFREVRSPTRLSGSGPSRPLKLTPRGMSVRRIGERTP
jgi:hypothetical protein